MTLTAIIQRGFDSTIANWPLLLIRVAGSVATTMVVIAAIVPIVMFLIYSGTMTGIESVTTPEAMVDWLLTNSILIVAVILILTLIIAVAVAIHSFITGGVAGTYLDADRVAPREGWTRPQLKAFTPDVWLRHGRRTWWPIFVIYNVVWGVWMLILLLPLLLLVPLMMTAGERAEAGIFACVVIFFWLGLTLAGSFLVHIWTQLAILECVREGGKIVAPVRRAVPIFLSNFFRIVVLVVIMIALMFGVAGVSFIAQFGFEMGMNLGDFALLLIPFQIVFSLIQTVVSVIAGAWLMACFATIVNESADASIGGASLARPTSTT